MHVQLDGSADANKNSTLTTEKLIPNISTLCFCNCFSAQNPHQQTHIFSQGITVTMRGPVCGGIEYFTSLNQHHTQSLLSVHIQGVRGLW